MTYRIELLAKEHEKKDFCCGEFSLDRYLLQQASQDIKRHLCVVYVLVETKNPTAILGYYSLSSLGIALKDLPEETIKQLPKYPMIPVTLLGRLAVAKHHQGKKIGDLLLVNALQRAWQTSQSIGSMAVVVEAIHHKAAAFYQHYGFIPFKDSKQLFLPMASLKKLFSK